jgi:hypothetical protein
MRENDLEQQGTNWKAVQSKAKILPLEVSFIFRTIGGL